MPASLSCAVDVKPIECTSLRKADLLGVQLQGGRLWRNVVEGRSNVFVYYSGHGVPDLVSRQPFLLPHDGDPNFAESGYPLETLYRNLELVKQKIGATRQVVVMVDAEVALGAGEGVAPLMRSVESCAVLMESVEAAAAAVGAGEDAVRRVDRGVVRERAYAAVRSWWSRCEPWKETVVRTSWTPAALSDLATAQAEWIVRRAPVEGYHVVRRDSALVLCWHGYNLAATSAWRC